MSSRNLVNLTLLLFIVILLTLVILEPGKDKPIVPPTLTNLNPDDIHDITIKRQGDQSELVFKKTASGWRMLKPYRQSANSFRLNSILKLLSAVSYSQNSLANLNEDEFGVKQPLATITFNTTAIAFGHNKSLKHHRYVKIDSTLHMIPDSFYYQLSANAASYIDHRLIPENSKITTLSLPAFKLEKHDGNWKLTPSTSTQADSVPENISADAINQLIDEWQLSQAYDIKIEKNNLKNNSNMKAGIIVSLSDGTTLRFKSTASKEQFTLTNIDSGVRYILSPDRKDKLLKFSPVEKDN